MAGSQQGRHPSFHFSLCISVHQYPSPPHLPQPIFPTFPIPPPPPALPREKDRLRVAMVMMECCWERAEVIEELLIRCGRGVMSHHVFIRVCDCGYLSHMRVTFSSPPILPVLFCPSLSLSFFFFAAKTCYQASVSVEPDASETRSWHLLQLSRTQCSSKSDQVTNVHTPGSLNKKTIRQFMQTPKDKSVIGATVGPKLTRFRAWPCRISTMSVWSW